MLKEQVVKMAKMHPAVIVRTVNPLIFSDFINKIFFGNRVRMGVAPSLIEVETKFWAQMKGLNRLS